MNYLQNYSGFKATNEGFKNWMSTFMLMLAMGLVPLSVRSADNETKRDFIETQSPDTLDAVKFINYLNSSGYGRPIEEVWAEFTKSDSVKSNLSDIQKYINRDGKVYRYNQSYKVHDYSHADINKFIPDNWMTDMGSFIPDSLEPRINNFISDFERQTSVEIGIVTVDSLTDDIFSYSQETFNRIGVGKKGSDNGILIVLSMKRGPGKDRARIHTGRGIEEFMTDYACKTMITNVLVPYFKKGEYFNGTMALLQSIQEHIGTDSIEKKKEWLKLQKEKEKRESDARQEEFMGFLFNAFIVLGILGIIAFLIYKWRKNQLTLKDIKDTLAKIEEMRVSVPQTTSIESDRLKKELKSLKDFVSGIDVNSLKDKDNQKHLEKLLNLRQSLSNSINSFNSTRSYIQNGISNVNNIDRVTSGAYSTIAIAMAAYDKIKDYGYKSVTPAQKEDIEKFLSISDRAKELLKTNIDSAIANYEDFKSKVENALRTSNQNIQTLKTIEDAKAAVLGSKSTIDAALKSMNYYDDWAESGEKKQIESAVDQYYSTIRSNKDYLTCKSLLDDLLEKISKMKSRWYSRKKSHDDAVAAAAAAAAAAADAERRRNDDSSSSGGGFGGFGGGTSGGGGASGDW